MNAFPVSDQEFSDAMGHIGPFETPPHLAVAVSGGADSMALCLLASRWASACGGQVTALTVDHGLRPGAAAEARLAGERLAALGTVHTVLTWPGSKPDSGIQAAARSARYDLLHDWCSAHGVLHLMTAHHAGDQAETMIMRMQRGSGPDGLAAMAPVRYLSACRLLRPLLAFEKSRLIAVLEAAGLPWTEDPSNENPRFERVRVRAELAAEGADVSGLAAGAARFFRSRQALDVMTAQWLARYARVSPLGFVHLRRAELMAVPEEIRLRALSRALACVGGRVHAPSVASVERLLAGLESGRGGSLARAVCAAQGAHIGIYREARNLPPTRQIGRASPQWDGRFRIAGGDNDAAMTVRPWSNVLAREWPDEQRPEWLRKLPARARIGLPVIETDARRWLPRPGLTVSGGLSVHFQPRIPLVGSGFSVA